MEKKYVLWILGGENQIAIDLIVRHVNRELHKVGRVNSSNTILFLSPCLDRC